MIRTDLPSHCTVGSCVAAPLAPDWQKQPLVVIGTPFRPNCAAIIEPLRDFGEVFHYDQIANAIAALRSTRTSPGLLVLSQPRRGVMSDAIVLKLRANYPLTRTVVVYGSWCEGETRSGTPNPGISRVPLHRWPSWIEQELACRKQGIAGSLDQAITSTAEEQVQFARHLPIEAPLSTGCVAILTQRYDTYAPLAELLARYGIAAVWQRPGEKETSTGIGAIVVDVPRSVSPEILLEEALPPSWKGRPIVVLTDAPRTYEIEDWHSRGAAAVLHRPFAIGELLQRLRSTMNGQEQPAPRALPEDSAMR